MPKKNRIKDLLASPIKIIGVIFIIEIILCPCLVIKQYNQKTKLMTRIDNLKNEKQKLESNLKSINQFQENQKMALIKEIVFKDLVEKKNKWSQYFKELSLLLPKDVWLINFVLEKKDGDFEIEISGEAKSQTIMADFYYRLSQSVFFHNLLIKHSDALENFSPPLYSFLLTTSLSEKSKIEKNKKNDKENDVTKGLGIDLKSLGVNLPDMGALKNPEKQNEK